MQGVKIIHISLEYIGLVKKSFFRKIKDTFLIFTNNFIDLDILSMLAISHVT